MFNPESLESGLDYLEIAFRKLTDHIAYRGRAQEDSYGEQYVKLLCMLGTTCDRHEKVRAIASRRRINRFAADVEQATFSRLHEIGPGLLASAWYAFDSVRVRPGSAWAKRWCNQAAESMPGAKVEELYRPLIAMAHLRVNPTDRWLRAWNSRYWQVKDEIPPLENNAFLHSLAAFHESGVPVDRSVVESIAARAVDPASNHTHHIAAKVFGLPILEPLWHQDGFPPSHNEVLFLKALSKALATRPDVRVATEEMNSISGSPIDFTLTKNDAAKSKLWIQLDSPFHHIYENGKPILNGNSHLQTSLIERMLPANERLFRLEIQAYAHDAGAREALRKLDGIRARMEIAGTANPATDVMLGPRETTRQDKIRQWGSFVRDQTKTTASTER